MKRALLLIILSLGTTLSTFAQNFVPYPNEDILSWDTSPYESYEFSNIPFRIMFPPSFDDQRTEKYPLILFFHGAGERGTDNEKQLVHGGRDARDAVNSGEFPGILLYPQHNNGGGTWGSWIDRAKDVVDKLIADYNIDPNRIYVHGLSGGGEATWRFAGIYPEIPAAIHPMSAAGSNFLFPGYMYTPIWSSQGGRDTNPQPHEGNLMVNIVRDGGTIGGVDYEGGGNIRYTYYPDRGHNTWNAQYAQPDFFTWFLDKHKTDILIRFGDGQFCEGDAIDVDLGITAGFDNYEWVKDDTTSTPIFSGPSQNEINVTTTGKYYVRFQRGSEWTYWSDPADINTNRPASPTPDITSGNQSVNLPTLDGQQSVILSSLSDKDAYQWYKDEVAIPGATSAQYTASTGGSYALSTKEPGESGREEDGVTPTEYRPSPQGCPSELSDPIIVTTENGINTPAKPSNFFANVLSENSIIINWDDNASDELGFELYRSTTSGSGYSLVQIIEATTQSNPQAYEDTGLNPNTTYYYRMRAVNSSGGSAYTQEVSATTFIDTEPPTAPDLSVGLTTSNSIGLSWIASTDNAGVYEYDVYRNGALIATVAETSYTNGGLPVSQYFSYVVRARDISGNVSPPSNQVTAATVRGGLNYEYYHHNNLSNVAQIETNGTLITTGNTNNFDITIRTQDDRFAFIWEGYVLIETAGQYTFYTDSDDGSKLYINDQQIVNNDGTHGCRERSGSISLPEGFSAIRVLMFENGGGECLDVEWQGPGISKGNIPDHLLYEDVFNFPDPPVAPSGLAATPIDYQQINLSWTDNSTTENGFEIYRSLTSTGGYNLVRLANEDETSWSDTNLEGSTTYYYKINAINHNGASEFDGPISATTLAYPAAPVAPDNLTLQALSSSSIQIDWNDNSTTESGFEIYRTTTDPGSSVSTDYALSLDGNNDYVAIDDFFYNSSGMPELTVEAWIKTSSGGDQMICSFDRNEYFRLEINGSAAGTGQVGLGLLTNGGQIDLGGSTRVDDGEWHHVAATYDNGTASIYVDGVLDASQNTGTTFGSGNTRYGFIGVGSEATSYDGPQGPTDNFNGEIEEVRIWSVARTEEEIANNSTVGLSGSETGLDAYFKITQGSGTTLTDFSATGASGTLMDGASWSVLDPALVSDGKFTLIHTTGPNVTTYTDNQVAGNRTYYYKVRAIGIGTSSAFTTTESISTPNRAPVITPIIDRSVKFETTLLVDVLADDPDGDPVTFTFTNPLPGFASFDENGYGVGQLTFSPTLADGGTYIIEITADDGSGGTDTESFTLTVSNNDNPVIDPIATYSIDEGFSEELEITATDVQSTAAIELTAENLPTFVNFTDNGSGSGTFTISPSIGDAGVYPNIRVLADDGDGGFTEEIFQINVNEVDPYYSLQINFSTDAEVGPAPWNNIHSGNGNQFYNNLVSNEGVTTDIDFQTFDATNAKFNGHLTADLPSGDYPDAVQETFWYKFNGTVTMRLQNLNPSLFYDFTFYAGINDDFNTGLSSAEGQPRTTRFTMNGQTLDLNAVDNATNTVQFTGVQPNANKEIVIQVTEAGAHPYFVMNALVVDVYFNDGQPPVAPDNLMLTATSSSTVDITWDDNSNNETRFEILRSETSETGPFTLAGTAFVNSTSFTDTDLEGSTLYYYKVKAINSNGEAETAVGLVTTLNSAPVIDPLSDAVMRAGEILVIPVAASDPEANPITLSSPNLPSFAQFTDNGDGTGAYTFSPTSEDLGFFGSITLNAIDNFSSSASESFLLTITDNQYAETVYINFDLNSQATSPWINLESTPVFEPTYTGFVSAEGVNTGIGLQTGSGWQGGGDNGLSSGNNSFLYEDKVVQSYWRTTGTSTLTITGLDPAKVYNFDLLASTNNWVTTTADYTVGGVTQASDATNNSSRILAFNSITPNGAGEVTITLATTGQSQGAYINALIIKSITSDIPITPGQFEAKGVSRTQIDLSWQDNSYNETGFEIYRTDEPGKAFTLIQTTGPNVTSYEDTGHSVNTAFIYKIRAISGSGNSRYTKEVSAITYDHEILININTPEYLQAASPWNNTNAVPESDFTLDDLLDEQGVNTNAAFYIESISNGQSNNTGMQPGNGIYPDEVLEGYYYLNDFEEASFMLNNLDSSLQYDITYFGSENGAFTPSFGPGIADFIAGSETRTLFTDYNISRTVTIENLTPDDQNAIPFMINSSDDNGSRFVFINALVVSAHRSIDVVFDKTAPTVPIDLIASSLTATTLTLEWSPSADNVGVTGYEVYQNGNLIGTTLNESFDVTSLSPGFTYVFTVKAFDANGNVSEFSEGLTVTTPTDTPPTLYYTASTGTVDITDLSSWGVNSDGTGANPANFIADNQHFILQTSSTLSGGLTINGLSSKLIVGDNASLTLNESLTAVVEARANSVVTVNDPQSPSFDLLAPTSTVVFGSTTNTIPVANYGNLSLVSNGSTKNIAVGNVVVGGTLTVEDGVSLQGATQNASEITVTGNMIVSGTPNQPSADRRISLNFNSGTTQMLSLDSDQSIDMHSVRVSENTVLTISPLQSTGVLSLGSDGGGGLILENGSTLNLGTQSLVISGRGSINGNGETGRIATSNGTLELSANSQSNSNVYFVSGADTLSNLLVDLSAFGRLNLQSNVHISNEVVVTDGTISIQDTLKLISVENQTARIAEIENRGLISGTVEVQRYMEGEGRIYRYMATSVQETTVSDWQEYIPITGTFEGASTGPGLSSNPTLHYYDEPQGGWIAYPEITNQEEISVGRGYAIFVREGTDPTTLKLAGEVTQGDVEFTITGGTGGGADDGWNLIGNPYPSPIEWGNAGWTATDISPGVHIKDNGAAAGGEGGGTFRVYDSGTGTGDPGFEDGYIASGQAVWVQAITPSASLSISENAKTASPVTDATFYRAAASTGDFNYMRVSLSGGERVDYTHLFFNEEYSSDFEADKDIVKRMNDQMNLFTTTLDGIPTAMNKLNKDFCELEIPLHLTDMAAGTYSFNFKIIKELDFDPILTLKDQLNETSHIVALDNAMEFNISDGDSFENRFVLSISKPELISDIAITQTSDMVCENELENYSLILSNTQRGVRYEVLMDNEPTGISITGNGANMEVSLSNSAITSGNYEISVKAEFVGCSSTILNEVKQLSITTPPTVTLDTNNTSICAGESIELVASSNQENSSFSWTVDGNSVSSNDSDRLTLDNLTATTTVMVSTKNNDGCSSNEPASVEIQVNQLETPMILESDGLLSTSIDDADQYQWYLDQILLSEETNSYLSNFTDGLYQVKVFLGACAKLSDEYLVTGIDPWNNEAVNIFPNPTKDLLYIEDKQMIIADIYVFDNAGREMVNYQLSKTNKEHIVDLTRLDNGVYTVRLESKSGVLNVRVIKN